MNRHILLEKAHMYDVKPISNQHPNYTFNEEKGYWLGESTSDVMMLNEHANAPCTKKCDRETGEDQKGE